MIAGCQVGHRVSARRKEREEMGCITLGGHIKKHKIKKHPFSLEFLNESSS